MPDKTRTNEPDVVVESSEDGRIVFRRLSTGRRWAELGECNRCGLCMSPEDPTVEWNPAVKVGEPGACSDRHYETRPLYVTVPEFAPKVRAQAAALGVTGCSLTFMELEPVSGSADTEQLSGFQDMEREGVTGGG